MSIAPSLQGEMDKFNDLDPQYSHLYMAASGQLVGVICIADPLRPEAAHVLRQLRELGISNTVMMTGDSDRTAAAIAKQVGVNQYFAEVLPEDKASFVQKAKAEGHTVVMIGDGINDSPALSAADIGIAINSGAAIAREIADVTIKADSLEELVALQGHCQPAAAPGERKLSLCAELQLHPHRAGCHGHPAAGHQRHAAQPVHHWHQPQEHDQPPAGGERAPAERLNLNLQKIPPCHTTQRYFLLLANLFQADLPRVLHQQLPLQERGLDALAVAVGLVALADDGDQVALLGVVHRVVQGIQPVRDLDVLGTSGLPFSMPTRMSAMMSSTFSKRLLSSVTMEKSARRLGADLAHAVAAQAWQRLPPQPNTTTSRWGW